MDEARKLSKTFNLFIRVGLHTGIGIIDENDILVLVGSKEELEKLTIEMA